MKIYSSSQIGGWDERKRENWLASGTHQGFVAGAGAGAAAAVSETTMYSYFFPLALNFILSLSRVNSMLVFTGISALSAGFSWRTWYSVVSLRTTYSWQRTSVVYFLFLICEPQATEFSEIMVPG
jgi:hypothetical protein